MVTFQREAKLYSDPATQDSSRLLPLVQSFLDNVRMCVSVFTRLRLKGAG